MNRRVLCVDDEPNILHGYQRALRKNYDITIAESGMAGLATIESMEPFAVIVADMRMPVMNGVQFLARANEIAPNAVRIMLTGNSDQQTAIDAVNQGHIFHFLNKPCSPETLEHALEDALDQHRLIISEKNLLEDTLNKSLQGMVDLLAQVNSLAYYRSIRIKRLARDIAAQLGVPNLWEVETAALLSQIGCITIPERVLAKITQNEPLHVAEKELLENHPSFASKLVSRIPRLQTAADIIAHQNYLFNERPDSLDQTSDPDLVRVCAQILKVAIDFDRMMYTGKSAHKVWNEMAQRTGWYLPVILDALKEILGDELKEEVEIKVTVAQLKPGMILDKPLRSKRGDLILAGGTEITLPLILRFRHFLSAGVMEDEIFVKSAMNLL